MRRHVSMRPHMCHQGPSVAAYLELVAWAQLTARIRVEEGLGLRDARTSAAIRLGLENETLERRRRSTRPARPSLRVPCHTSTYRASRVHRAVVVPIRRRALGSRRALEPTLDWLCDRPPV